MLDKLAVLRRVIEEHRTIMGNVKMVGDSMNDIEALFRLQRVQSDWFQSSIAAVTARQEELGKSLQTLHAGLTNHFAFETENLPQLFGVILMKALELEHRQIMRMLNDGQTTLSTTKVEGMTQAQVIARKSQLQKIVNDIMETVQQHHAKEEVILKLAEKALVPEQT
jgi:hemerythrin